MKSAMMRRLFRLLATLIAALPALSAHAGDIIGNETIYTAGRVEILSDIAIRTGVGFVELRAVNPAIDPWEVRPGTRLLIPDRHILPRNLKPGFTVNIGDMRIYYSNAAGTDIRSWPVGIGREGRRTPTGELRITELRENPTWRPTPEMRALDPDLPAAVPPGPGNPLGQYAIRIGWDGYVIHGTNKQAGVGRRVSSGCLRLYDADIREVFELAKVGTPVAIVDERLKAGFDGNALYLEAHPSGEEADQIEVTGEFTPASLDTTEIAREVVTRARERGLSRIDWATLRRVAKERRGIPEKIAE